MTELTVTRQDLEDAAKAYGFGSPHKVTGEMQFCWTESEYPKGSRKVGALWNYVGYMDTAELWNPEHDSGDAFKLAFALDIQVFAKVGYARYQLYGAIVHKHFTPNNLTEACKAIVLAAAEIERSKNA